MENCIDEFCLKEKIKVLLNLFLVSWRLRYIYVYGFLQPLRIYNEKSPDWIYFSNSISASFLCTNPKFTKQTWGKVFFLLFLGFFFARKKRMKEEEKFGKIVCKYYAIYLSLSFELFVWFYLFCFCFFIWCFLLLIPGVPNTKIDFIMWAQWTRFMLI